MVGGLTAKADAHYKRDVSSILPIPESPQGVQALDDGGSVAGRQRESWLFLPPAHPSVNMSRFGLEARKGYLAREPSSPQCGGHDDHRPSVTTRASPLRGLARDRGWL